MSEAYSVEYGEEAEASLAELEKRFAQQIRKKITIMAENVETVPHYALTGNWSGYYRLRSGDYRILYQLDHAEKRVFIRRIGNRRDAYDE